MGLGWDADAKTLRTTALSLVYSTAEYCVSVWCRSAPTRLIDSVLNDALRLIIECLRPTPTDHLLILSDIQPAELRRMGATLSLAQRESLYPDHILYDLLSGSSDTRQVRLRSRCLTPSPNCECGASEQTADHVLTTCPIHWAPHGAGNLTDLDDETRCWFNNTTASI